MKCLCGSWIWQSIIQKSLNSMQSNDHLHCTLHIVHTINAMKAYGIWYSMYVNMHLHRALLVVGGEIIQTFVFTMDLFRFVMFVCDTISSTTWLLLVTNIRTSKDCIVLCNRNSIQRILPPLHYCFLFESLILPII